MECRKESLGKYRDSLLGMKDQTFRIGRIKCYKYKKLRGCSSIMRSVEGGGVPKNLTLAHRGGGGFRKRGKPKDYFCS